MLVYDLRERKELVGRQTIGDRRGKTAGGSGDQLREIARDVAGVYSRVSVIIERLN